MKHNVWIALAVSCLGASALANAPADLGPCRYEWRASTFTPSAQHEACLAVDAGGDTIVVWSSRRQQEGRAGVFAQRFDADGVCRGGETPIGLLTCVHQTQPAIACAPQGHTWIAWEAFGQDGEAGAIILRRFDAGLRGGNEVLVNQQTRGHQSQPVVAALPDGGAVVAWLSDDPLTGAARVCGRWFKPDGTPRGDEFNVSGATGERAAVPSIACHASGVVALVYSVFDEQGEPAGIRWQRYSTAGERLGEAQSISGTPRASQIEPVVAATPDGFVVAWLDAESDGSDYGVLARRVDLQGTPSCDPFVVNRSRNGPQNGAAIAVAADGGFTIAWNDGCGDACDLRAQRFDKLGRPVGDEFRVNDHAKGPQQLHAARGTTRLAYGQRGDLVCAWQGDADRGDKSSVNITLLAVEPVVLAGRVQGVTPAMAPATGAFDDLTAEPHVPPTFDAALIDRGEREISWDAPFGFDAILNTGWTPPDPHAAVGPEHIVAMTNGAIAFFEKDGTKTFQQEIEGTSGFWGSVGATSFIFDPEVLYDGLSGRWFAMAAEGRAPPGQTRSYVLVAVSDDSDPNGTWHKYRFDTTNEAGDLFDSPNIAVDADVVYVTGDGFGVSANYPVYTFDKASLLAGQPPAVQRKTIMPTSTQSAGIPPVSYDDPPALYMIEHGESGSGGNTTVRLIALRDPLGTITFQDFMLTVPRYDAPESAPQQGSSVRMTTFDARFWSVAYRNGSLWATHHVDDERVRARWYEIRMNGWPASDLNPELVQSGEIDPGGTVRTFFTSIGVSERNDAVITCARSSPTEYISMVTALRLVSDPPGTFRAPVTQRVNTGPYTRNRWGDYSTVDFDPAQPNLLWAHHEYASGSSWNTWIARVDLGWGDLNCDGLLDFADINPFVLRLTDPGGYQALYPECPLENGDIDGDGLADFADINPFVDLLVGP